MPARSSLRLALATLTILLLALSASRPASAARPAKKAPAVQAPQAPEAPWPLPAPLPIERFTLANGMRVVVQTDRTAPLVAVGLMVDVGARDEQPGLTGLAHFFEHMMFQGSRNVAKMEHFHALEAVGAELNANTTTDRTWYYQVVPRAALELALWLEWDRFAHLQIDQANVDNQRQAVLEERRERLENRPYAAAEVELERLAFAIPALQHPTIGEARDIAQAPLAAFRSFWETWYTPNNVVLTLVGDLSAAEARQLAAQYLGVVARRAEPKHASFAEPAQDKHVYAVVEETLGRTPGFHLAWRVPAAPHADSYALDLLAEVLGGGEASRLEKRLTRERALATGYAVGGAGRRDEDLLDCWVEMAEPGLAALLEAKRRVRGEIQDIALHGVTADELRRAKVAFETGYVFAGLSAARRGELLAQYELFQGDAGKLAEVLPRYRQVTSADLQRVAQTWTTWSREVEIDVIPTGQPRPKAAAKPVEVTRFEAALQRSQQEAAKHEALQAVNAQAELAAAQAAAAKAAQLAADERTRAAAMPPLQSPPLAVELPVAATAVVPLPGRATRDEADGDLKPLRKVKKGGSR